jgi:tetratricopeptide (TPR) repeat protein
MNHGISASSVVVEPPTLTKSSWFYNAGIDLIIGCGAWSLPLLLLAYYSSAAYPQAVPIAFYALALLFNYPHYMATIYRAFRTKEEFAKYKIFTVHITLLFAVFLVIGHLSYQFLAFVFTLYLTWSPFHYTGQNFGIALMFARRGGVQTTVATRRAFHLAFFASYLMFFLTFHSFPATDDFVLSLGIPVEVARIAWLGMLTTFLISITYSLSAFIKQTGWRAMTAPLVMLSTQIVWFVIPSGLTLFTAADFLQAPATVAVLALMHSAQYLWITSYYARREAQAENSSGTQPNNWRYVSYFFVLILGGIALFVPGPWLASRLLKIDFGTSFLVFTALVNLHHFILDGAIWKLRDGRIASFLLNTQKGENGVVVESKASKLAGWIFGKNTAARFLRVSVVFALLLIAALDQIKFYYSAKGSDAAGLVFAQQLNPYDASVHLKLARDSQNSGDRSMARAALEEAVRINPDFRQAQTSLAKLLIESSEYEAAYEHYKKMFAHLAPDVNSLVNFGILASRLNKPEEAVEAWQKAVALDKNQSNAHFYLAEELLKKQDYQKAILHYESYLVLATGEAEKQPEQVNPFFILKSALQLGLAYHKTGNQTAAATFLTRAVEMAEQAQQKEALVSALIQLAEVKAAQGDNQNALSHFQRALILEKTGEVFGGKAADWLSYAKFLQNLNAPPRLVFAAFLKAENQATAEKDAVNLANVIKSERQNLTSQLTETERKSISDQPDVLLAEVLSFKTQ